MPKARTQLDPRGALWYILPAHAHARAAPFRAVWRDSCCSEQTPADGSVSTPEWVRKLLDECLERHIKRGPKRIRRNIRSSTQSSHRCQLRAHQPRRIRLQPHHLPHRPAPTPTRLRATSSSAGITNRRRHGGAPCTSPSQRRRGTPNT